MCCCYKKPQPSGEPIRARLDSIVRTRLDSVSGPRTRVRTWSDALLARVYSHRYSTPPAYEPPPPYHVALDVEMAMEKPPPYTPIETLV